jgi:hypothetical protein
LQMKIEDFHDLRKRIAQRVELVKKSMVV